MSSIKNYVIFASRRIKIINIKNMAQHSKYDYIPTPIFYGEKALRFMEKARKPKKESKKRMLEMKRNFNRFKEV